MKNAPVIRPWLNGIACSQTVATAAVRSPNPHHSAANTTARAKTSLAVISGYSGPPRSTTFASGVPSSVHGGAGL